MNDVDGREARIGVGACFAFRNERRLLQAFGDRTPMAVWRKSAAPEANGHVDNARALTTCPQERKQAQPSAAFWKRDNQPTDFLSRRQKWSRCAGPLYASLFCDHIGSALML
jgi:hypothetical protein